VTTTSTGDYVWAVAFDHVDYPEIDSLWSTQEGALARAEKLKANGGNTAWEVLRLEVEHHDTPAPRFLHVRGAATPRAIDWIHPWFGTGDSKSEINAPGAQ